MILKRFSRVDVLASRLGDEDLKQTVHLPAVYRVKPSDAEDCGAEDLYVIEGGYEGLKKNEALDFRGACEEER